MKISKFFPPLNDLTKIMGVGHPILIEMLRNARVIDADATIDDKLEVRTWLLTNTTGMIAVDGVTENRRSNVIYFELETDLAMFMLRFV